MLPDIINRTSHYANKLIQHFNISTELTANSFFLIEGTHFASIRNHGYGTVHVKKLGKFN